MKCSRVNFVVLKKKSNNHTENRAFNSNDAYYNPLNNATIRKIIDHSGAGALV